MRQFPGAVLFDFDGVIVNSEPLHFLSMHGALQEEGIEISEQEYYSELIGFDDRGAYRRVFELRRRDLEPGLLLRLVVNKNRAMMAYIRDRKLDALPGVERLVRSLWRRCPLAICSGALREEIEAMLEGVRLRDCFRVIVAAEDVTVGKPDPQGYLRAMKLVSQSYHRPLKPEDCLVVEDAPAVIHTAGKAGFQTLGIASTYPIERLGGATYAVTTLQPAEVRAKVPSLADLDD